MANKLEVVFIPEDTACIPLNSVKKYLLIQTVFALLLSCRVQIDDSEYRHRMKPTHLFMITIGH